MKIVLETLLLGDRISRWDGSYLYSSNGRLQIIDGVQLEDENNIKVKDPLFISSLSSRINPNTKAIVIKEELDKAKDIDFCN